MHDQYDDLIRRFAEACRRADIAALQETLATELIALRQRRAFARRAAIPLYERADNELSLETVNGRIGLALRRR